MSRAEVSTLVACVVLAPFAGALVMAALGGAARTRKAVALVYAAAAAGLGIALLVGYLEHPARASWGSLKLTQLSFPAVFILNMLAVAGVLYAAFRESGATRPSVIAASIPAACGFGSLALAAGTLAPQVLFALGASAAALLGLLAHGRPGAARRLRGFVPWLLSDALLALGAILCYTLLNDADVLIKPPLTSGTEAQVIVVIALFLASALIRLGVFPVQGWVADLVSRTDPSWSSFHLGSLNFVLAASRLVVTTTLMGRLLVSDWSLGLAIAALVSVVAGPLLAARSGSAQGCAAGLYCMQSGFLLLALSLYSRAGTEAALFMLLTVPLFMTAFLMGAGTACELKGSRVLGWQLLPARTAPGAYVAVLASGLSLAGVFVTDGFIGKAGTALASLDKAGQSHFYALASAACLAAAAVGLIAVWRLLGGTFGAGLSRPRPPRPGALEGIVPLAICAFSFMLGIFPGLLLRNFIERGSRTLFAPGFQGPAVVFRGTGGAVDAALRAYRTWGPAAAAFLLALGAIVLFAYFASRAAHPSAGPGARTSPFLGGAPGTRWGFRPSAGGEAANGRKTGPPSKPLPAGGFTARLFARWRG